MKQEQSQPTKWLILDQSNLPDHRQIFEFKHPDYGVITGSIVQYSDKGDVSNWVFPDGGMEADIWVGEFTHYRRIEK